MTHRIKPLVDKTLVSDADLNEALAAIIGPWWSEATANYIRGGRLSVADIKAKYVLRDLFAKHIASALEPTDPLADAMKLPEIRALVAMVERLNSACDTMWNDHERLEECQSHIGKKMRLKDIHVKTISEAQQALPEILAALTKDGE